MLVYDRAGEAEPEQQHRDRADGGCKQLGRDHALVRQGHERARRQLDRPHRSEVQGTYADCEQRGAERALSRPPVLERHAKREAAKSNAEQERKRHQAGVVADETGDSKRRHARIVHAADAESHHPAAEPELRRPVRGECDRQT